MRNKLISLFGEEWYKAMEEYLHSPSFLQLGTAINQLRQERTVYPAKEYLFREFRELPPSQIKVVYLMDQVIDKHYCHLVCGCENYFESKHTKIWQKEIEEEYPELKNRFLIYGTPDYQDLSYLRKQGIFFLNTHLTDDDKLGWQHEELWEEFIQQVVLSLNKLQNLTFVLSGRNAWKFEKCLISNPGNKYTKIPHVLEKDFIGCGVFRKINYQLEKYGKGIEW